MEAAIDRCAVIIPAYNEAAIVNEVLMDIRTVFPPVLVLADGSSDDTSVRARSSGASVVRHCINIGQGGAVETGTRYALSRGAEYFLTMDADGQHQVSDALGMLRHLHERRADLDIVLGSRFLDPRSEVSVPKRLLLRGATLLSRQLHGLDLTDTHNGLRVFGRAVAERLRFNHVDMAHASDIYDLIRKYQFRYEEYPVLVRYTHYSRTKGQPMLNAINIFVDALFHRVR